ncbi:hypothetical protein F4009_24225 [Candidatus Poribacteria bacterium]|nr:hypothetical protein [Candidatus Poribacteria bacterium]MYH82782.1 hypothetical protein [Candidatus Poribacteria bacterium]MYK97066.1 hypothetical protein [Candidatus Poribacteria bacterium]
MDFDPLVEIGKDEGVRFIVRKFLELARDKVENFHRYLKDDDSIDLDNPNEVEEKALRQILSDPQNKKCEYILNFLRNVKKEGIDNDTAYSLLQSIDNMSWRQFCILSCLHKRHRNELQIESGVSSRGSLQVDVMLSDVRNLMSAEYIVDGSNRFLNYSDHNPDNLRLTGMANELIRLLELGTISDEESDKPFLPWGITRTKRQ